MQSIADFNIGSCVLIETFQTEMQLSARGRGGGQVVSIIFCR